MDANAIIEENDNNQHASRMDFARHLHSLYPEVSVKGWEMRLIRHFSAGETSVKNSYEYDQDEDTYKTTISGVVVCKTGAEHRQMMIDWSNGMMSGEFCVKHDLPQMRARLYRRLHKMTRKAIPVTNEQLYEADEQSALVEEIISSRRQTLMTEIAKKQHKEMVKDSENWNTLKHDYLEHMVSLQKAPKTVPKLSLKKATNPYALVVCPTDFHWGKYGWVDEVGESYNFEEARKRLMEKTETLVSRISTKPEKIYVGAGSDWFHVDNDAGMTTRGTPQDMCATPAEILITGCKLAREHIDMLRQVAPVEIVMMAGNHDRHSSLALMMYLSAAYENVRDVEIVITPNNRRYIEYGNTLLGFTHGDGLGKTALGPLMAVEAREQWGNTEHKVWFHGHLHHQRMHEKDGCLIIQMPSLAGHDRYHARSGYTTSKAGLAAYLIDDKEGYIGSLFAPVSHE